MNLLEEKYKEFVRTQQKDVCSSIVIPVEEKQSSLLNFIAGVFVILFFAGAAYVALVDNPLQETKPRTAYVNTREGSDVTGDGSQENPWKTMNYATIHLSDSTITFRDVVMH